VISGEAKGRRLFAPPLAGLRPTSDRAREAIFDALSARHLVEGARVLDLFSGSGALGIEALSRGAATCTFVDSSRKATAAVERNLAACGFAGRPGVRVVREDVLAFLGSEKPAASLALCDPPYAFSDWPRLLEALEADVAVLEHSALLELAGGYEELRRYRYGGTLVTLVARPVTDKDTA
jgi:16S rRNA (guanine966-N2)-methyltransferase